MFLTTKETKAWLRCGVRMSRDLQANIMKPLDEINRPRPRLDIRTVERMVQKGDAGKGVKTAKGLSCFPDSSRSQRETFQHG